MKKILFSLLLLSSMGYGTAYSQQPVSADTTTVFTNPVLWADVPDPDVIRVNDDFYLMSTTMHLMPGAPMMHSKDLVNWETVSYVFDKLTDTPNYDLKDGTVYGRGQWATSIRYHDGRYYALFSPNDVPYRSYIYSTENPAGKWELLSRTEHFHDSSLFFDDDGRVYVFYGTGSLRELKSDLSGVKEGGVDMRIFEPEPDETGLLEGSRAIKYKGKYYLLMISWPKDGKRRQVCYRADKITGPYEKKVILEDDFDGFGYVGQGCIVDDAKGNWYGVIFQDRGGVGRVLTLMPCRWEDGWPMLGDKDGRVPKVMEKPVQGYPAIPLVVSDDFSGKELKINWQWNHNPVNDAWSLAERPGYLRLKTSRVVDNLYAAPNTLTQRMEGPQCTGTVSLDISRMKDGDISGFCAFNGHSGLLSVIADGDKKYLAMSTNVVNLRDSDKAITKVETDEKERVELMQDIVYLRIDSDFRLGRDMAAFYYSLDNKTWNKIGTDFKMIFDYTRLFMGTKFAIFNYATKAVGGYVDVDFFEYKTDVCHAQNPIVQTWCTPDPAPMVYKDSVYVYTGHDEDGSDWFHMNEWRVYSTADMANWTDHGSPLALEDFKWASKEAWASQCIERNGKFYWYICAQEEESQNMAIGVAVGDTPTGPFHDALGRPLVKGGWGYIDPTVWVDEDGQAYLYWGNPGVFYVKLNEDMISYSGDVVEIEQNEANFGGPKDLPEGKTKDDYKDLYEEGPWFYKRGGKYYLLYAAGGVPEHISYSMSDSPTGPWKYMGNIMPLQDTGAFTNHCGVIDFKGNSYFFYHTGKLPNGGGFNRSTAVEQFTYNPDGTFPIINMTQEGVSPVGTFNPYRRVEAETMAFSKGVKSEPNDEIGLYISEIHNDDYIKVCAVDFGKQSPKSFTASVASALRGGFIEVRTDSVNGKLLATLSVSHTGGWECWNTLTVPVTESVAGLHDLYFVFKGRIGCKLFNLDWWAFEK